MFVQLTDAAGREKWDQHTLVLPSISVGNVGQLAIDLIISTLDMVKVGRLHDNSLVPVVGNDPFKSSGDECQLMTAAEVFESKPHKMVVVQLRSAIVKGRRQQFIGRLLDWVKSCQFRQVVLLCSSFSHERMDSQLQGSQLRYVATPEFMALETGKRLSRDWITLEKRALHPAFRDAESQTGSDIKADGTEGNMEGIFIPGGGLAKSLLEECTQKGVPLAVVIRFCSEGNNVPEAVDLVTHLNKWAEWVNTEKSQNTPGFVNGWKIPSSWKLLFGSGFQQLLFQ